MIQTLMYRQSSYDEYCNNTLKRIMILLSTRAVCRMNMYTQEEKDVTNVYYRMSNVMAMSYLKEALFVDVF